MNATEFMLMRDWRTAYIGDLLSGDWINVQRIENNQQPTYRETLTIFPILAPAEKTEEILSTSEWELSVLGEAQPGFVPINHGMNNDEYVYQRYFWEGQLEPLVLWRSYESNAPSHYEIVEEFRLFHNLYENIDKRTFIKFDEGDEIVVVHIDEKNIRIRRRPLLQFLAAKQYHLVLYFDLLRLGNLDINSIPAAEREFSFRNETTVYNYDIQKWTGDFSANALLHGKSVLISPPIKQSGIWPYEAPRKYVDFIVEVNDMGNEITHTCNVRYDRPPGFLVPVYFKRAVLGKYYDDPSRYRVNDGGVEKIGSWSLRADTNHREYVIVFLGDLGRGLPHVEQVHWRAFNIAPPADPALSETQVRRAFFGEWAEPVDKALLFKSRFDHFQKDWFKKYGWYLFRPLHEQDMHHLTTIHRPIVDHLRELENLAISLSKLLLDSLNDGELRKRVRTVESGERSIKKLEKYLDQEGVQDYSQHIAALHELYHLRTNAAAHRKDTKEYPKTAELLGIGKRSIFEIADDSFDKMIALIETLREHFLPEH